MAIICRDYKLLYIMVPATGCSSLGNVLLNKLGGEWIPSNDIIKNGRKLLGIKHNTIQHLVNFNLISDKELNLYLKFANVRNPFDRYATGYQRLIGKWVKSRIDDKDINIWFNKVDEDNREKIIRTKEKEIEDAKNLGFEKWLYKIISKTEAFKRLKQDSIDSNRNVLHLSEVYPLTSGVDKFIRSEYLESDFNALLRKAGIIRADEWISVPHANKTPGKKPYQDYYTPEARALIERVFARELAVFDYSFEIQSVQNHLDRAETYKKKRQWQEAILRYQKASELDPQNWKIYHDWGEVLFTLKRWSEAARLYRRAIEIEPNVFESHHKLGQVLQNQDQFQEATASYQSAIKLSPNFADAHHKLGQCLTKQKKFDEAIAAYQKAVEIEPECSQYYHSFGDVQFEQKHWTKAIAWYKKAIKLNPNLAWSHYNHGRALAKQGKKEEAIAAYERALEIKPSFPQCYRRLHLLSGRRKDNIEHTTLPKD